MEITHFSKMVFAKAKKRGSHRVFFTRDNNVGKWLGTTWDELAEKVQTAARSLMSLGVKEEDKIGICSQNMLESVIVDFANFANRAISIPMYATASASQIEYMVNDAKIALLFVGEQQQYDNALEVINRSEVLTQIVVFDPTVDLQGEMRSMYFKDFLALGNTPDHDAEFSRLSVAPTAADLALPFCPL